MKKYKKFWAVLLTLAMVLGMSMTTMAAPNDGVPDAADVKDVTVSNVENGVLVTAYQIIGATYNKEGTGFTGYKWLVDVDDNIKTGSAVTIKSGTTDAVVGLTSSFITDLAKKDLKDLNKVSETAKGDTVTLALNPGTWLILVTGGTSTSKVYNPMVASVYYSTSGSSEDMIDKPVTGGNWTLETTGAYAKVSDLALTKTVDDDTKETVKKNAEGNDILLDGEKVTFTVTTTIPSYSNAYGSNLTFSITDTLNPGLRYATAAPVVKVNGNEVDAANYTSNFDAANNSFTISFKEIYLKGLAADENATKRSVEITYGAYVTSEATTAEPGVNTVTLTYSDSQTTTKTLTKSEKVYTFDITGAVKKVKEDGQTALPGATFTLYRGYNSTTKALSDKVADYTTTDNGAIVFSGLGALENGQTEGTGTYYLKETAAPATYTINDTVYKVEIKNITRNSATDDTIKSYDVVVTNLTDNTTTTTTITVGSATPGGATTNIVNTKLTALPSTGGIGTTIFTIGGCAIMIAAAFLFFASRKKNDNK